MGLWKKIKNGLVKALVVGAIGIKALLPSCGPVVPEIKEPITTPITTQIQNPIEIYLHGYNPYRLPVGNPIPKSVIDAYTVVNNTGEDFEVKITLYDDPLNTGEGSIKYVANTRNYTTEEKRVTKRVYETEKLDDMLKTPTLIPNPNSTGDTDKFYTVEEAIKNIPFEFPNGDIGFEFPRGTNNDNIEGTYSSSGSWVDSLGNTSSYENSSRKFSNQKDFSIDKNYGPFNTKAVIIGYEKGKIGIINYVDYNEDGINEKISLSNVTISEGYSLEGKRLELFLYDDGTERKWVGYNEILEKQQNKPENKQASNKPNNNRQRFSFKNPSKKNPLLENLAA